MAEGADLYEQDFVAWTEQQAARIRAAADSKWNVLIDWGNVAEEIEDLGKSLEHKLGSHLTTIIEHLLKFQHSPARDPRPGWAAAVVRARVEVETLLEDSPSLRTKLDSLVERANRNAAKIVRAELEQRGEIVSGAARSFAPSQITTDEILGDWLPEPGKSPA